jgi:hypothetical protein
MGGEAAALIAKPLGLIYRFDVKASPPSPIGRSRRVDAPVSFLRAARDAMLSAQSGGAKSCQGSSISNVVARQTRANQKAADLAPIIAELRAAGITSHRHHRCSTWCFRGGTRALASRLCAHAAGRTLR